ncbi:GNAT family N-acetyltransferase [Paeniglutamicibacter sp. ZC-3]|uniref:GNAT family N-acetyltransferase n=1 Tax=Paeniglutamicibacter sp. ZC-3 TaxID=2986919 RepID=UPI0021F7EAF6|nr:GNAT family N-acetyltransferase [Paeniglutamicibacter sp. ZC-3]MCV9995610.1 GNAT family N-acetyltransferase [Paeniglutamicibacter sp. ZC-3]
MEPVAKPNTPVVAVRDAVQDDAAAIARALVAAWRAAYAGIIDAAFLESMDVDLIARSWARTLARGTVSRPIVAVVGGDVVGFCQFGVPRDEAAASTGELYALNLLPECWGRGLGTVLLHEAAGRLRVRGYSEAYLWVAEGNQRAMDLYLRHGWRDTGITKEDPRFTPPLMERRFRIGFD